MKTKVIVLALFFSFLLVSLQSFAQIADNNKLSKTQMLSSQSNANFSGLSSSSPAAISSSAFLKNKNDYGVEGSMYLNPEFTDGVLVLNDNSKIEEWKFRYNMLSQKIQFIRDADTLALGQPSEIKSLAFNEMKFIYTDGIFGKVREKALFEVLVDGNCKLLLYRDVTHHYEDLSNDDPEDDIYVTQYRYFIKNGDKPAKEIIFNKKKFLKCVKENTKLKNFIEENNLRCKKLDDFVRIVEFMNGE